MVCTVAAQDLDTAIVTAVGFDFFATNYQLRYLEGLSYPTITTGTLVLSGTDSAAFQGLKVKINVPSNNTNYAFRLFSTGVDTVLNSDTTQLDNLATSPSFFAGGITWIEGTDTTQTDSIYTSGTAFSFEIDGLLYSIDSTGTVAGFSAEYQAVYDDMTTPPGADTAAQQNIMFNRILDTADLDLFYLTAQSYNSAGEADINWISPGTYDLTAVGAGGLTGTKYQGYTGDGTNYLSTNYNASLNGTNYVRDDGSFGVYIRNNRPDQAALGVSVTYIWPRHADGNTYYRIQRTSDATNASTNSTGFWVVSRRGVNDVELYRNGSGIDTDAAASEQVENATFTILAGAGATQSQFQVSAAFVGEGLTDEQVTEINAAIEAYMDFLGTGVEP